MANFHKYAGVIVAARPRIGRWPAVAGLAVGAAGAVVGRAIGHSRGIIGRTV